MVQSGMDQDMGDGTDLTSWCDDDETVVGVASSPNTRACVAAAPIGHSAFVVKLHCYYIHAPSCALVSTQTLTQPLL
jgi:hypothetical protein